MEISIGDYELVYSGTIIGIGDDPIKIKLPDEIEGDFSFEINFIQDSVDKKTVTNYTAIDNFTLKIDFMNFNGCMGAGNTTLIKLGTLRKKPLYLNYRVFDLATVSKALLFNFYVGKEDTNGN